MIVIPQSAVAVQCLRRCNVQGTRYGRFVSCLAKEVHGKARSDRIGRDRWGINHILL
jgi:hypothetical protein